MNKAVNPCVHCYFARMRTDICGIYCTGGFEKQDGTCEHFKEYKPKTDMALVAQSGAEEVEYEAH